MRTPAVSGYLRAGLAGLVLASPLPGDAGVQSPFSGIDLDAPAMTKAEMSRAEVEAIGASAGHGACRRTSRPSGYRGSI